MKYLATVSDTNERIEANSFKAVYMAARHIARSNEQEKLRFCITLSIDNKPFGIIFYKSVPDETYETLEKVTMSVYIFSGDEVPLCRKFVENWQWIAAIDIEGEDIK